MNITNYKTNIPVPDTIRIDINDYYWYKMQMHEKHGAFLPDHRVFKRRALKLTELQLNQEHFVMDFVWRNRKRIKMELLPGFISDIASSPSAFRGFVDNDSLIVFIPAYALHDPLSGLHLMSFEESNELFYDMIVFTIHRYYSRRMQSIEAEKEIDEDEVKELKRWKRRSLRKSKLYKFGVSSFIGRKIYNESDYKNHWNVPFVKFSCVDIQ